MAARTVCMFFIISLLNALPASAQDLPEFRGWLNGKSFLIERGLGKNLYRLEVPFGEETPFHAPEGYPDKLPDSLATLDVLAESPDSTALVLDRDGDLFLWDRDRASLYPLTDPGAKAQNPTFAPDGRKLAFTSGGNLYVLDLAQGNSRALTRDGDDTVKNGYASWVYYEEVLGRSSRYRAFYWSPDSRKIAFLRFDDNPVPEFPIFHHENGDSIHGMLENTRYPKAGDDLPVVSLHVADLSAEAISRIPGDSSMPYIAQVQWAPSGRSLFFQQMNRDQNSLRIFRWEEGLTAPMPIIEEKRATWLYFRPLFFLEASRRFIMRSDRSGWTNLYLYDYDGKLETHLVDASWNTGQPRGADEENGLVYFEGSGDKNTEWHLFRVQLDGDSLRQLSSGAGYHQTYLSPGLDYFVDRFSRFDDPGNLALYDGNGSLIRELGTASHDPNKQEGIFVEQFTIPTPDGYDLPAYWVLPPGFDPTQRYPLIFNIYGGPNAESVNERFRDYSDDPMLQNGVIRFGVDHRGSGKFGREGLDQMHRKLGFWELNDYREAVYWLHEQTFIDTTRIGIRGGSYGGYLAALALTRASDLFTHGVARAPVTDWRLYDNVYTERYMDMPADNDEGYKKSSVIQYAPRLRGKLLLIHGTVDDNVHMQHTVQLVSRLQDLGKTFDLMIYPGGRHGWGGSKRIHARQLEENFFLDHFFGNRGGAQ